MGLLDRINARAEGRNIDAYINDVLIPAQQFNYLGTGYTAGLNTTYGQGRIQEISQTLPSYMAAAQNCPPVFAAQMVRALVLSQARFTFRNPPWHNKTPRRVFGSSALAPLERPWHNATTGEMNSRLEWHAGLAGNAYVTKQPNRLRVLRPDWVAIVYGSDLEPEDPMHAIDGDLLGYIYQAGGIGGSHKPITLLPDEVAHWSPIPDPLSPGIGMSWVTPAVRDIQGDVAATDHKLQFFKNGATPNLVVKGLPNTSPQAYWDAVEALEQSHTGVKNAYKTLYLTAGADATVVGSNMQQIDFKATQGNGETRISMLSRVPATILGISEGLAGSSLNAGNFGMARRIFADSWVYPMLQDLSAALAPLVRVPNDAELWFDTTDIPLLREDAKDAADIAAVKSQAIRTLTDGGYDPASSVATIAPDWTSTLQHTGKLSVQLQEPGAAPTPKDGADPAARNRSGQPGQGVRKYNPGQPRDPGGEGGGQWTAGPGGKARDALKLAGKIDLAPNETLVGSSKVDGDIGGIRMALTEQDGQRKLRFGAGGEFYGRRIPDEGIKAWDGNPPPAPLSKSERERLGAESEELDYEYDSAPPARQNEIDARLREIHETLASDDQGFNGTAKLDEYGMNRLTAKIGPALAEAVEQEKAENAAYDELVVLQDKGSLDTDRMEELKQIARLEPGSAGYEGIVFAEGIVPGSEWGDVHYSVELDDLETGTYVTLGVSPKGAPDDWGDGRDWKGQFDAAESRKFLRLLGQYTG